MLRFDISPYETGPNFKFQGKIYRLKVNRKHFISMNSHFERLKDTVAHGWPVRLLVLPHCSDVQLLWIWRFWRERIKFTLFQRPVSELLGVWKSNVMNGRPVQETHTLRVSPVTVSVATSAAYCSKKKTWAGPFPRAPAAAVSLSSTWQPRDSLYSPSDWLVSVARGDRVDGSCPRRSVKWSSFLSILCVQVFSSVSKLSWINCAKNNICWKSSHFILLFR